MDWPLTGMITGIVVLTGAATYGVVGVIQSDIPLPAKATKSSQPALVAKSALLVFVAPSEPHEQFDTTTSMATLSEPPPPFQFDQAPPEPRPTLAPNKTIRPAPLTSARQSAALTLSKPAPTVGLSPLPVPPPVQPAPAAVQWRVVATAQASYFNLGGHIDNAGTVDSLASGHLRDAFKAHRNFEKLPPDVKTHILTQNISLTKIAPYRQLLGINDKKIEQEQAVRFVASTAPGALDEQRRPRR